MHSSTADRPVGWPKRAVPVILIALPLLYLLVDLVRVPVIFNGCGGANDEVTLRRLVEKQIVPLGSYLGHTFYVSLDAIQDSEYLGFLKSGPTALVIGIDHDDPSQPYWGGLTRAVLRKFDLLSSTDAAMLRSVVVGEKPSSGHLLAQRLHIPERNFGSFPVNHLYIVGVKSVGSGDVQAKKQQSDVLQNGLRAVMAQARADRISNLIVPCIGVDPGDRTTLQFKEFFPLVFAAAETTRTPSSIYLSVYQDWNDDHRSNALKALQDAWTEACNTSGKQSTLVREEIRLILVGLFVCLLVSSLHVAITVKNFLIIASAFAGLGYGAFASLHPFVQDWTAGYRLVAAVAVLIFLAVAFPFLPRWNPKNIFDKRHDGDE